MTRYSLFYIFSLLSILTACERGADIALGTLERDRIVLKANANEIITAEPIPEGTQVAEGTLLLQLDDRRQKAKVARAQAELVKAESYWEELRNGARIEDVDAAKAKVNGAKAQLVITEKNFSRAQQLIEQNLVSQSEFDKTIAERDSAGARLESANKALLVLTNGSRPEELAQAQATFNAAQAQLELEQLTLAELSIRATRDGVLDSLPWNRGERVNIGTTVAVLLADKTPFARVYIPEPWRAKVKVGDTYVVNVDGIESSITGRVRWISNDPAFTPYYALNAKERSRLVYLAELDLENNDELPTGVPVQIILNND